MRSWYSFIEPPEDAAKETQKAPCIMWRECQTAHQQAQIMPVGGLHRAWRVTRGLHCLLDQPDEQIQCARRRGWLGSRSLAITLRFLTTK